MYANYKVKLTVLSEFHYHICPLLDAGKEEYVYVLRFLKADYDYRHWHANTFNHHMCNIYQ